MKNELILFSEVPSKKIRQNIDIKHHDICVFWKRVCIEYSCSSVAPGLKKIPRSIRIFSDQGLQTCS